MTTLEEVLAAIANVRTLKSKHSARKGNLKRQYNHHISIKDVSLDRQRLTDLDRRHEAVLENITAYDLIQDRIEELDTEEAIENEKDEVLEQHRHSSEVAESYQTLIDASQAWVQDEARDLTGTEDMVGVYARQSYEHLVTEDK